MDVRRLRSPLGPCEFQSVRENPAASALSARAQVESRASLRRAAMVGRFRWNGTHGTWRIAVQATAPETAVPSRGMVFTPDSPVPTTTRASRLRVLGPNRLLERAQEHIAPSTARGALGHDRQLGELDDGPRALRVEGCRIDASILSAGRGLHAFRTPAEVFPMSPVAHLRGSDAIRPAPTPILNQPSASSPT